VEGCWGRRGWWQHATHDCGRLGLPDWKKGIKDVVLGLFGRQKTKSRRARPIDAVGMKGRKQMVVFLCISIWPSQVEAQFRAHTTNRNPNENKRSRINEVEAGWGRFLTARPKARAKVA
jgi:hypothetical protein